MSLQDLKAHRTALCSCRRGPTITIHSLSIRCNPREKADTTPLRISGTQEKMPQSQEASRGHLAAGTQEGGSMVMVSDVKVAQDGAKRTENMACRPRRRAGEVDRGLVEGVEVVVVVAEEVVTACRPDGDANRSKQRIFGIRPLAEIHQRFHPLHAVIVTCGRSFMSRACLSRPPRVLFSTFHDFGLRLQTG